MHTQRRTGPIKATVRRRENKPFVDATVTVRRMADRSIHLVVQAPGGNEAYLRIDNLPRPAEPNFTGWAKRL